jgi:bromodomain-containing protein 7
MNLPYVRASFHALSREGAPLIEYRPNIFFFFLQDDFRLVISNAKTFNPPGTIYHTEAERIEAWASDHISKASSFVIEYETEWNIDVDRDEDVNVDADEDGAPRVTSIGPDTPVRRSPSVLSASNPPFNRRGKNAAAKKEGMLSESVEPDGHLPGYKDGVGVFPPGSDWAEVMLALKLKGTALSLLLIVCASVT